MALLTIPVWTIPPDWSNPVTETLEWLTGIFSSLTGAEQRQSLRRSPRRAIEFGVTAFDQWRTYYDSLMSTQEQVNFYIPLWHDRAELAAAHTLGSTTIRVHGSRVEMQQAGVLFVQGSEPWLYDILEVTSVAVVNGDAVFTLTGATTIAWAKGTPVYAATVGTIISQPTFTQPSDASFQSTVRFDFVGKNDWPFTASLPTYRSHPVVELEINAGEPQSGSYFRRTSMADNQVGLRLRDDFAGIGFAGYAGTNFVVGQAAANDLRSLLYTLRGRRNPAWFALPTSDFVMTKVGHAADTAITVRRCGFTDLNGPVSGRQDIRILLRDGTVLYRRIVSSVLVAGGLTESLGLDSALGGEVRPDSVVRISFLVPGRLDQDAITLTHTTDTDGVCGVSLAFKTVPDLRTGNDWFPPPFPLSNRGDCGPTVPGTLWFRIDNGPWNNRPSANVSIGEGGIDISAIHGNLFPILTLNTGFAGASHETVNFGGSPFAFAPPYRSAAWGVTTTWNPADLGAMTLTNGNLTAGTGNESTGAFVRATTSSGTQFGFRYFELHIDQHPQNLYIGFENADKTHNVAILDGQQVLIDGAWTTGVDLGLGSDSAGHVIGVLVYTGGGL